MRLNYQQIRRDFENDSRKAHAELTEALASKDIKPEDFSLREAAEHLIPDGREFLRAIDPRSGYVMEDVSAVNTAQFSAITGQFIYAKILESFNLETAVFTPLVEHIKTNSPTGEKIPGVGGIGDQNETVPEGGQYPRAGLTEDYIWTPPPVKRGTIVSVTKEAIVFDRTGLVLREAGNVGEYLGLNKERRIVDAIVDENSTLHRYRRREYGAIATYGDNSGYHDFDNLQASNALVDWTDVDALEQLLNAIVDPNTGEAVNIEATDLIVTKQLEQTAARILNATEIEVVTPGYATSANPNVTRVKNPYSGKYRLLSSKLLAGRMATDTSWFLGNVAKCFAYMEAWGLTVVQNGPNSHAEFNRDIVAEFKASEMGAATTLNPRGMAKSTA